MKRRHAVLFWVVAVGVAAVLDVAFARLLLHFVARYR